MTSELSLGIVDPNTKGTGPAVNVLYSLNKLNIALKEQTWFFFHPG